MDEFTGTVRISRGRARLHTNGKTFLLVPYPKDAPIEKDKQLYMGALLFEWQRNKEVKVRGYRSQDRIYNATVSAKPPAVEVPTLPLDELAASLEGVFEDKSPAVARKLSSAGIHSDLAFYHRVADYEPEVDAFSNYLKVPTSTLRKFLDSMTKTRPKGVQRPPQIPVARGINVKKIGTVARRKRKKARANPPRFPEAASTPDLPSLVDLTSHMTPICDQGPARGTCVAHTASAAMEHALIRRARTPGSSYRGPKYNKSLNLSEQYLYWACKEIDGAPDEEGTFIEYAAQVLREGVQPQDLPPGVIRESAWRYNSAPIDGNEGQGPPPTKALRAPRLTPSKANKLDPKSIPEIKAMLNGGHCVGLSVYTYHFWTDGFAWREGVISLPFRIEYDGAHAICLVGYEDEDTSHRDGYFRFKNSWGPNWGYSRPDKGFGDLPYRYILTEGIEAWSFEV